jgi:hypothetical protein
VEIDDLLAAVLALHVPVDHAGVERAGRNSALIATMSSKQVGRTSSSSRMPLDSIWNTPLSHRARSL